MDLTAVYEHYLGMPPPGRGKVAFRMPSPDRYPDGCPYLVRVAATARGTSVFCRSRAVLRRARGLITPALVRRIGGSEQRAREALSALGRIGSVAIDGPLYATPAMFRPHDTHLVWCLDARGPLVGPDGRPRTIGEPYVIPSDTVRWAGRPPIEHRHVLARGELLEWSTNGDLAYVAGLYTEEAERGKGMAKAVASAITADILARGKPALYLAEHEISLAVAHAVGYRRLATVVTAYGPGKT